MMRTDAYRHNNSGKKSVLGKPKPFDQLMLSERAIENGYGEYIVFNCSTDEKTVTRKTFERASEIFKESYLRAIENNGNLYERIRAGIKKMDSSLDIAFIPRTLFDLVFIRASIEEEIQNNSICDFQYDQNGHWSSDEYEKLKQYAEKRNGGLTSLTSFSHEESKEFEKTLNTCWHFCRLWDENTPENDNPFVKILARRVNNLMVEKFQPNASFNGKQISKFTEDQLDFYQKHHQNFLALLRNKSFRVNYGCRGSSINFGCDYARDGCFICFPMGIKDDRDVRIVQNAIALECDKIAQKSFILYRAGEKVQDTTITKEGIHAKSLSYGTSLFAGALFDEGATVYHYTGYARRDTYATIVPWEEYDRSPYQIPLSHAVTQLISCGEFFHGRSKISTDSVNAEYIAGIFCDDSKEDIQHLTSSMSDEELSAKLNEYHSKAISL
jgi:hypothetical protein